MRDAAREYRRRTPHSEKLFQRAKKVMPGGVCHNIRYFPPYPFYIKEAKGSRIRDVDGNEYIDLWMAHYEAILGHSPEIIVNELSRILSKGTHWGLVNEYQVELAELICQIEVRALTGEYVDEWVYDSEGCPVCTVFEADSG